MQAELIQATQKKQEEKMNQLTIKEDKPEEVKIYISQSRQEIGFLDL